MYDKDILTVDVDWAPDDIIEEIAQYLLEKKVKATWFITHDSPATRALGDYPDYFERGIHPNFFENSSHGKNYEDIINYCLDIVPEAVSMRSHGVYQNGRLMNHVAKNTPIKVDSTTFLPEMAGIHPLRQPFPEGSLLRAPFFWADDYEICLPHPFKKIDRLFDTKGLRIYMFHPIHIALNTSSWQAYQKARTDGGGFPALPLKERAVKDEKGIAGMFTTLVNHLSKNNGGFMLKSVLNDQ